MTRALALLAFVALTAPTALGFQLGEHERITRMATDEWGFCRGAQLPKGLTDRMVRGNLAEDLNFYRKWTSYSHFFHPTKNLADQRRYDASIRIIEIAHALEESHRNGGALEDAYSLLGAALHYLQDAASPPHVVPVMHGLSDGFESYELPASELPNIDYVPGQCRVSQVPESARKLGLLGLLTEAAQKTLDAVRGERFAAELERRTVQSPWTAFWVENSGTAFGTYGVLGNSFGQGALQSPNGSVQIEASIYVAFKRARIRDAITFTHQALRWLDAR